MRVVLLTHVGRHIIGPAQTGSSLPVEHRVQHEQHCSLFFASFASEPAGGVESAAIGRA